MARFVSLFTSPDDLEKAIRALKDSLQSEEVRTSILDSQDWKSNWEPDAPGLNVAQPSEHELLDLWMDRGTADYFSEGLKQGGTVLVVEVPDEFSKQAQKIVKDKRVKLG